MTVPCSRRRDVQQVLNEIAIYYLLHRTGKFESMGMRSVKMVRKAEERRWAEKGGRLWYATERIQRRRDGALSGD